MGSEREAITVAICTYNRYEELQHAVDSVLRQDVSGRPFRILVVDNSDDLDARDAFYDASPFPERVQVAYSDPPGLSRARNQALRECRTRYLAYLDDDAIAQPGWLAAVLAGFGASERAAAVCGPIAPIWPEERPAWLSEALEACLAILDYGPEDRILGPQQYAYGANMAFLTEALVGVGGFSEEVGRKGARTLLSMEELLCQDALRVGGYHVRYAAAARVSHRIDRRRLSRNWFRSRMAWQAVSEALQNPPVFYREWALTELARLAGTHEAGEILRWIFRCGGAVELQRQAELIRHLVSLLLFANEETDASLGKRFGSSSARCDAVSEMGIEATAVEAYLSESDQYRPSAAIAASTTTLFVEATPGHAYLSDHYASLPGSQTIEQDLNPWAFDPAGRERAVRYYQYVYRSLTPAVENVVFLTLDPHVYGDNATEFLRFVRASPARIWGILHRVPQSAHDLESLGAFGRCLGGVMCLSEEMTSQLRMATGFPTVSHLPLHPVSYRHSSGNPEEARRALGVGDDQVVFSAIGEARRGKGIGLILDALERVPPSSRGQMFLLFAGKVGEHPAQEVRLRLLRARVNGYVDLRETTVPMRYAVLTDREYAGYVEATDIGLLVYQDGQRNCMSGILPDYVWNGKRVVATADSLVGREVIRHDLGVAIDTETPEMLAKVLVDCLRLHKAGLRTGPRAEAYRQTIAPESVLTALRRTLEVGTMRAVPSPRPDPVSGGRSMDKAENQVPLTSKG